MKNILFTVALALGMVTGYAQLNTYGQYGQNNQPNRWRLGMGAGLSFGNHSYVGVAIAPSLGYDLGNGLEAGATLGYQYNKNDFYKSNLFSMGPYLNYMFIPQFFGRVHYEYFTGNQTNKRNDFKRDIDESALWIGGGYQSRGRVSFRAGVMYNVLYKENESIFSSAVRPFAGVVLSM
ncbi:hypothetical protein EDM00_03240 [Ornithobacterium rhinotracheale]|uniref:hypothetical protein n=1 Tax=Ornithobacterium rhinotracheale TaxID=28251 RepID=UPI00129CEB12|nr:hypothetical protein [Ornithobacterium rhinotracheale]MRI63008.1 hypothetical protein [Ornithobacterium rhinotracheale]MRJ08575.1 hypothetical protein [Ornithobacterium rhinotracheale]MRJ10057.1 hypothetical protein [Ornithobacterium rhinotracheale]UOH76848.1 hypothetical protein MT996_06365 [Ornithobacterium rhinotracheale]